LWRELRDVRPFVGGETTALKGFDAPVAFRRVRL